MTALTLLALIMMFSCGSDNNPIGPTPEDDAEYYPLSVGNIWVYDRSGSVAAGSVQIGTISGTAEIEITGTATHSGGFEVFVQENSICDTTVIAGITTVVDSTFTEYMRVTSSGLYGYPHLTDSDSSFTVPFPLQEGATWNFSSAPLMTGEILSMSESVTVTAGHFDNCLEMRTIWTDTAFTVTNTADFAKNVGDVRNVFLLVSGTMTTTVTNTLETYSVN